MSIPIGLSPLSDLWWSEGLCPNLMLHLAHGRHQDRARVLTTIFDTRIEGACRMVGIPFTTVVLSQHAPTGGVLRGAQLVKGEGRARSNAASLGASHSELAGVGDGRTVIPPMRVIRRSAEREPGGRAYGLRLGSSRLEPNRRSTGSSDEQ